MSAPGDEDGRPAAGRRAKVRVYEFRDGAWIDPRGAQQPAGWWTRIQQGLLIAAALALLAVLFVFALAVAIVIAPIVVGLAAWALWRIRRHLQRTTRGHGR